MKNPKKITQEQIDAWKAANKRPQLVEFEDGSEVVFATPDRKTMKQIFGKAQRGGPIAMVDAFVDNCYLGGDLTKGQIKDKDNTLYTGQLTNSIDQLMNTKALEVKKL